MKKSAQSITGYVSPSSSVMNRDLNLLGRAIAEDPKLFAKNLGTGAGRFGTGIASAGAWLLDLLAKGGHPMVPGAPGTGLKLPSLADKVDEVDMRLALNYLRRNGDGPLTAAGLGATSLAHHTASSAADLALLGGGKSIKAVSSIPKNLSTAKKVFETSKKLPWLTVDTLFMAKPFVDARNEAAALPEVIRAVESAPSIPERRPGPWADLVPPAPKPSWSAAIPPKSRISQILTKLKAHKTEAGVAGGAVLASLLTAYLLSRKRKRKQEKKADVFTELQKTAWYRTSTPLIRNPVRLQTPNLRNGGASFRNCGTTSCTGVLRPTNLRRPTKKTVTVQGTPVRTAPVKRKPAPQTTVSEPGGLNRGNMLQ